MILSHGAGCSGRVTTGNESPAPTPRPCPCRGRAGTQRSDPAPSPRTARSPARAKRRAPAVVCRGLRRRL